MYLPDIYFLSEWGKAFQELDNGEACVFDFNNTLGHVYYSFLKRKVPDSFGYETFYDTITPFGFGGPILIECNISDKELLVSEFDAAFNEYCKSENIIAEYVRFNPWLKNHSDFAKVYNLKFNTRTLFTDLTVKDIFMQEYCSKIRTKIRKAQKNGVKLEYDYTGSSLEEFYRLYQFTLKKTNVSDYYNFNSAFLIKVSKSLGNRQFVINAIYDGQYITSAIFMEFGDYLHYHLVANDYRYYSLNATSLILYEAAIRGQKNGKIQMHLGGAPTNELFSFKKQFTKNGICDFFVGTKIRNEKIYIELVDLKRNKGDIKDKSYFPVYRG